MTDTSSPSSDEASPDGASTASTSGNASAGAPTRARVPHQMPHFPTRVVPVSTSEAGSGSVPASTVVPVSTSEAGSGSVPAINPAEDRMEEPNAVGTGAVQIIGNFARDVMRSKEHAWRGFWIIMGVACATGLMIVCGAIATHLVDWQGLDGFFGSFKFMRTWEGMAGTCVVVGGGVAGGGKLINKSRQKKALARLHGTAEGAPASPLPSNVGQDDGSAGSAVRPGAHE